MELGLPALHGARAMPDVSSKLSQKGKRGSVWIWIGDALTFDWSAAHHMQHDDQRKEGKAKVGYMMFIYSSMSFSFNRIYVMIN